MKISTRNSIILIFILLVNCIIADSTNVKHGTCLITKENFGKIALEEKWLFINGDNLSYAQLDYNDSHWIKANSKLLENEADSLKFKRKCWFRLHLFIDSLVPIKSYIFSISQKGSSQIFFNGELINEVGIYGSNKDERNTGENSPMVITPIPGKDNVIAIRYENAFGSISYDGAGNKRSGFTSIISETENYLEEEDLELKLLGTFGESFFVFFFAIGLIHFLLYLFYRIRKSNLLFSIFCFIISYYFLHLYLVYTVMENTQMIGLMNLGVVISFPIFFVSLLSVVHSLFYEKTPKHQKYFLIAAIVSSVLLVLPRNLGNKSSDFGAVLTALIILGVTIELARVMIIALKNKKRGSILISMGFGSFVVFIVAVTIVNITAAPGSYGVNGTTLAGFIVFVLFVLAIISIPLAMSIFLAWDFGQTNKSLSKKVIEIEELSAKSIEQEKEKQKILSEQNEKLEAQVIERTKEISEQKKIIEEKNKDITDSINYAQRIQRSILPTETEIKGIFENAFVLFKPRDIVSGDFYQFKKVGDYRFAILADCTGHGVPGALMSMIGSNLLKQIIVERKILEPNLILSELHKEVKSTLRQTSGGAPSHDGMDASVVLLKGKKIYIASANRPVFVMQNGELTEIKPDKRSIGGSQSSDDIEFTVNEIAVQKDTMLYLFSDGYADQFGGETGKKFKVKNLSALLLSIHAKPLDVQHEILNSTFDMWKNHLEQVDDVSLIGIRF